MALPVQLPLTLSFVRLQHEYVVNYFEYLHLLGITKNGPSH